MHLPSKSAKHVKLPNDNRMTGVRGPFEQPDMLHGIAGFSLKSYSPHSKMPQASTTVIDPELAAE